MEENLEPLETSDNDRIIPVNIEEQMKTAYIDYSMSVIVGRALPDVRDGLKPVHRRILFAMNQLGLHYNKPYKSTIHTEILLFMTPWFVWHRSGACVTQW